MIDTKYFVINAATDTFKVSLTKGGSAVDITSNGAEPAFHTQVKVPDL